MNRQQGSQDQTASATSQTLTTYFFVRHGQTDWNVQGKMQGHTDIPLNDTGRNQAVALKKGLAEIAFSACLSSDLQRASETASIVISGSSLDVVQDEKLREFNHGDFEGKSWQEFQEAFSHEEHAALEHKKRLHVQSFLSQLSQEDFSGNVLVVTHGGFIASMLAVVLELSFVEAVDLTIENTAFVQMYFSGSKWVVEKTEGVQVPVLKE